jgi:hypothetical protein
MHEESNLLGLEARPRILDRSGIPTIEYTDCWSSQGQKQLSSKAYEYEA